MDRDASLSNHQEEMQSISFSCSIPEVIGRGFVEVMSLPFSVLQKIMLCEHFNLAMPTFPKHLICHASKLLVIVG